jgi:hypothetical protein
MIGVISDIWYCLRLVQLPRPGISCAAGDPGVGYGQLYTDNVRTGHGDHATPVMQVATGAGCRSRARASDHLAAT